MANRTTRALADAVIRARWVVLAGLIATTVAFGLMIPRLQADFTPSDLFASFGDQEEVAADFSETFGNTSNVVLFIVEADDVLAAENLSLLFTLTQGVEALPRVQSAQSIASLPRPPASLLPRDGSGAEPESVTDAMFDLYSILTGRGVSPEGSEGEAGAGAGMGQALLQNDDVTAEQAATMRQIVALSPLVDGRLVSEDRSVASVVAFLEPDVTRNDELAAVVEDFEALLASVEIPVGTTVSPGGLPYVRTTVVRNMRADQTVLLPAAIIVSLLILLLAFRWIPALVLPTISVAFSAVILVGGMALVGEPFNILNNIIPTLVIIIGISNAIHIINRYRDNLARSMPSAEAASDAMATMLVACFLTSFTTAVGFAALGVSRTEILRNFGFTAAIGVMIAYVVTILLVPPSLSLFPPPKIRRAQESGDGFIERAIAAIVHGVVRARWAVVLVATALIGLSLWVGLQIRVDSAVLDQVNPNDEVFRTTRLIEEKLGGIRPLEVFVRAEHEGRLLDEDVRLALDEVQAWASEQPGVLAVMGYDDFLREARVMITGNADERQSGYASDEELRATVGLLAQAPRNPLAQWLVDEGRAGRVQIMVEDMGALKTNELIDAAEAIIAARFDEVQGVSVRLTGDAFVGSRGLDAVIGDLISSLTTAVLIIFLVLTLLFRSLRLGLIAVPPALFPLALTLGYMSLRDIPLNTATAIIFSISIGITVDGCIHVLARFREEFQPGVALQAAVFRAMRGTGKAIVFTCFALIVGFGVMLTSQFVPIRRFGELIAVTVFIMLLATVIVLPALLVLGYGMKSEGPARR